jgi:hypothetical protein
MPGRSDKQDWFAAEDEFEMAARFDGATFKCGFFFA